MLINFCQEKSAPKIGAETLQQEQLLYLNHLSAVWAIKIALAINMIFPAARFKLVNVIPGNLNLMMAFQTRIIDYLVEWLLSFRA